MPPALYAWFLSAIPSSTDIFPISSVYANIYMYYLLWRNNNIDVVGIENTPEPEDNRIYHSANQRIH